MVDFDAILAADIGGTHSRVVVTSIDADGKCSGDWEERVVVQRVCTRAELRDLLSKTLSEAAIRDLRHATLAFAGPVTAGEAVSMTNWSESSRITISDLCNWCLPEGRVSLLNDMEAAAWGLVDLLHEGAKEGDLQALYLPRDFGAEPPTGHVVLLMPGTGFGSACLIALNPALPQSRFLPISMEAQHSAIPPLDSEHEVLVQAMAEEGGGYPPSWEDFVSGRGLEWVYRRIVTMTDEPAASSKSSPHMTPSLDAAAIAEAAIRASDPDCIRALRVFYRCAARYAQFLALALRPCRGVFLAGGNTQRNLPFLRDPRHLTNEFLRNRVHRGLLESVPLYSVTRELNLAGALRHARERSLLGAEVGVD